MAGRTHEDWRHDEVAGASTYLMHHYVRDGRVFDLTLMLVKDHTGYFSVPCETRDYNRASIAHPSGMRSVGPRVYEDEAVCAARAADEELHVSFWRENWYATHSSVFDEKERSVEEIVELTDLDVFSRRYIRFLAGRGSVRRQVAFMARRPVARLLGFGAVEFKRRSRALEAAGAPFCYCETTAFAHVPVRELLSRVPLREQPDFDSDRDAWMKYMERPGTGRQRDVAVRDVHGKSVQLRDIFVFALGDAGVRDHLAMVLREFDESRIAGTVSALSMGAAAAAPGRGAAAGAT